MYKILNSSILYKFLFLILFIGVLSNKIGILAYFFISVFIIIFVSFRLKNNQISPDVLFYCSLGLLILYGNFIYQIFQYDYNNLYYIQFFGSQIFFFLIFGFFIQISYFIEKHISTFLLISVVVLSLAVFIDYILLNNNLTSYQLMYRPELITTSYLTKPLGLFAQYSVNSTYAVVFYMLYLHFKSAHSKSLNTVLFFLVTLVIILQNSGTGYIVYLLLLLTIFYRYAITRYLLIPIIILISIFIVQSNIIQKVSSEYLFFLFEYFYNIIDVNYLQNIHGILDILFGIDGTYNLPIDFGPIFMIGKVGLLYFIFYSSILLHLFYKAPSKYFRMTIFILAFGNLHYPTLFYPIMNVLVPLLLLYILNLKKIENKRFSVNNKGLNLCVE